MQPRAALAALTENSRCIGVAIAALHAALEDVSVNEFQRFGAPLPALVTKLLRVLDDADGEMISRIVAALASTTTISRRGQ